MINATCPLVTKVHNQGKRYAAQGRVLILIGHAGHPEVEGTQGQIPLRSTWYRPSQTSTPSRSPSKPLWLRDPDHAQRG